MAVIGQIEIKTLLTGILTGIGLIIASSMIGVRILNDTILNNQEVAEC